jgi:hypothetical protein
LEAAFLEQLARAQLRVVAEERDLLREQYKSLVQLMAEGTMAAAGSKARPP